jgi:type IV pilus assembly protein PilM
MGYHIGIELSPSFFKLVEVKKGRRRFDLHQYVVHPLPSVWSQGGSLLEREEFIHAVQEALLGRDLHTERVHVAIPGRHAVLKRVWVPEMPKRKYRGWIEEQLLPVLDLPFDDPVFDFQLLSHVWADGDEQEMLLALVPCSYIDNLVRCLRFCGLDPVHVDLAPLALHRWMDRFRGFQSSDVMFLHLCKQEAEISYFRDGQFCGAHVVDLPMSSFLSREDRPHPDPLTPILAEEDEVTHYAEELKIRLYDGMDEETRKWFERPHVEWVISGEGVDPYLLENKLSQMRNGPVTLVPPAELVMTDLLREKASKWTGTSLSVPLGLIVGEGGGAR